MHRPRSSCSAAFTRIELLSAIVMVALLSLLPLRGAASITTKGKNSVPICLYNLRQLTQAWQMYAEDHRGTLPANETDLQNAWVRGVLDYTGSPVNTNLVALTNTIFGAYVRRPEVYRCPADESTVRSGVLFYPRVRSYSMNSAIGTRNSNWLPTPQYRTYTNISAIVTPPPSRLWIFLEEHPDSINDGSFGFSMPTTPASTQMIDFPAAYHDFSAGLSFADGHAEMKRWLDPRTLPPIRYNNSLLLNVPQPNNPDILWLAERTSSRSE